MSMEATRKTACAWAAFVALAVVCLGASAASGQEPLPGYPTAPVGGAFYEPFAGTRISAARWEKKYGWQLWDSWLDKRRVRIGGGNLWITTNARDTRNGLLKVGGLVSRAFYAYGRLTVRAKASTARGVVTSFYLFNEDKDKAESGRHEEIDVELSSREPGLAAIVTFHNDDWTNDERQNDMHRGGLQNIRKTGGLERFTSHGYRSYVIDWRPDRVTWYINGVKVQEFTQAVPSTPMQIHLDSSHSNEWSDFVDTDFAGSGAAKVDSVRYEPYPAL